MSRNLSRSRCDGTRMFPRALLLRSGCALIFGLVLPVTSASSQSLPSDVRRVLEREEAGEVIDRRVEITSNAPASNWHRGIVVQDGNPVEFEKLKLTESEKEYRDRRPAQISDLQHIELAQWCEKQRQTDRMRAHLQAVIKNQPNDVALRSLLGHSFVDGRWYSPYQKEVAKKKADARSKGLVAWLPKVARIAQQCSSRSTSIKRKALSSLSELDDPQSVYAIESIVYEAPATTGEVLVNKLADFSSVDCCLVLARIALDDSVPPSVAKLAEKNLLRYDRDLYVPELLSLLQVNQRQTQLVTMPTGDLVLNTLIVRELQNRKEVMRLRKYFVIGEPIDSEPDHRNYWRIFLSSGNRQRAFNYGDPDLGRLANAQQHWMLAKERRRWYRMVADNNGFGDNLGFLNYGPNASQVLSPSRGDIRADEAAFAESVKTDQAILKSQLERAERQADSLNKRVIQLLHRTQATRSNQADPLVASLPDEDSDVETWWAWWAKGNDQFVGIKDLSEGRALIIEGEPSPSPLRRGPAGRSRGFCFTAGTPIQSSRGLVSIEDLRVGDLVLSQEIESGELGLKPVLELFRRPAAEVYEIAFGNDRITSTGGHFWWVAGKGWLRTRELRAGMKLRTARSIIRIDEAFKLPLPANSYNLRVADFGTVFVGNERSLCNDNEFPRPTMRTVPGFGNTGL